MQRMNTEWNKAVRRTMNLPFKTRTNLLPLLVKGKSFAIQHRSRISKFLASFSTSSNAHVAFIGERAKHYSHSARERNATRCGSDVASASPDTDLAVRSHAIRELLDIRDGTLVLPGTVPEDIESAINYLCCY